MNDQRWPSTEGWINAKMIDIPSVLLRTDFRMGGHGFGRSWNLMLTDFPRSTEVMHKSIELYSKLGLEEFQKKVALSVIDAFDSLIVGPSLLKSYEEILSAYSHVVKMCGGGLNETFTNDFLHELVDSKMNKKVYTEDYT
ncbi:hypothetical protein KKA53_01690 [Candidatus Dependentiae bacterium]|nr:hypothetical protein [Candidatus Dependentiae bacterium]